MLCSGLGLWVVFDGLEYPGTLSHDCFPFFCTRLNLPLPPITVFGERQAFRMRRVYIF